MRCYSRRRDGESSGDEDSRSSSRKKRCGGLPPLYETDSHSAFRTNDALLFRTVITLSKAEARKRLVAHLGLNRPLRSAREVLTRLRCIQLDPLDVIGTNADLVVMARVDGAKRDDVWKKLFPRYAFEHFFKERCILPASAFAQYRVQGHRAQVRWWRHEEREERVPPQLVQAVYDEIRECGPVTARELTDHGTVAPIDWAGWKSTSKATSMALEILWTRCDIVVAGRTPNGSKLYDIPKFDNRPPDTPFEQWFLRERVHASGLYAPAPKNAGGFEQVQIEGSSRRYLATPEFLEQKRIRFDDRVRILGPLDPLLWDRNLVRHIFDFDYVWEVYKPAKDRKWGWYVCPLLHRDRLIGRIDAHVDKGTLNVRKLWLEAPFDKSLIQDAIDRHAAALALKSRPIRS